MPNWAMGQVTVKGEKAHIVSFVERFISHDDPSTIPGKKYFARSFLEAHRDTVLQDMILPTDPSEPAELTFLASFAWSAHSCIVSGYPESHEDECITLIDACMEDLVDVEIRTSEPGLCFEEELICTQDGSFTETERDLSCVRCPHCGAYQSAGSFDDPDELECYECGEIGLVRCNDEEDE